MTFIDELAIKRCQTDQLNLKDELVLERPSTQFFGGAEPARQDVKPFPQSSLTFDDKGIENIAKLVFKGMQGC